MNLSRTRRHYGSVLLVAGAAFLVAAVFLPWYSYEISTATPGVSGSISINSYLGTPSQAGTLQCTSSGNGSCPGVYPASYDNTYLHEDNAGAVAQTSLILLVAGLVVVLAGGFLGFRARDRVRWARPAALVAILGVVLAVSASAAFAADYSGALSKDVGASPSFQSGPWTSFTGTNSSSPFANESQSYAWGPAIGWYLPFGAIAWVGAGAFLLLRYGKGLPSTPVEGAGTQAS